MGNPLYNQMGGQMPIGNISKFIQSLNGFTQSFRGDARQMIQNMMNNGKFSQEYYNAKYQQAQEIQKLMQRMMGGH